MSEAVSSPDSPPPAAKADSPRRRFWRRLLTNPLGVFSMVWFAILVVAWIAPELLATHDPFKQDITLQRLFEGSPVIDDETFGAVLISESLDLMYSLITGV